MSTERDDSSASRASSAEHSNHGEQKHGGRYDGLGSLPVTTKLQRNVPPPGLLNSDDQSWLYPKMLNAWHTDIRGQDAPRPELLNHEKVKACNAEQVIISFEPPEHADVPALRYGSFNKPVDASLNAQCLAITWHAHSQVPCLRIRVHRGPEESNVCVWIFVNNIKPQTSKIAGSKVMCFHEIGSDLRQHLYLNGEAPTNTDTRTVWETTLSILHDEKATPGDASSNSWGRNGLKTTGIDDAELCHIMELGDQASEKGDPSLLSPADWAIWALLSTSAFKISRMWPRNADAIKIYGYFNSYMTALFNDVAEHGHWPHYRRQAKQAGIAFDGFEMGVRSMKPPNHLALEWRVTYVNRNAVYACPEAWAAFPRLGAYPDMHTKAIALRLESENPTRHVFHGAHITSDGMIMNFHDEAAEGSAETGLQPSASNYDPDWRRDPVTQQLYRRPTRGGQGSNGKRAFGGNGNGNGQQPAKRQRTAG